MPSRRESEASSISAPGAGTAIRGNVGFEFDRLFLPMLLSHAYKDNDGQAAAIVLLW